MRSVHPAASISSAMRSRYGSSAVPRSPAEVVARLRAHCGQVDGQRHRLRLDGAEVALLDGARKRVLVGDGVEVGAQVPAVAAVGRGGHAEHVGGVEK